MHSFRHDRIIAFEPVSRQRRLARRRSLTIAALVSLAAVAWALGAMSQKATAPQPTTFSAFTSS